jgi:hypothetical protein
MKRTSKPVLAAERIRNFSLFLLAYAQQLSNNSAPASVDMRSMASSYERFKICYITGEVSGGTVAKPPCRRTALRILIQRLWKLLYG